MKKLLLTALVSLLVVGANAQIGVPKELHCTEEAITFNTSIGTGWHFSKPMIGHPGSIQSQPVYIEASSYMVSGPWSKTEHSSITAIPFNAASTATAVRLYRTDSILQQSLLKFQLTDKFSYALPIGSDIWQPMNNQLIKWTFRSH